MTSLTENLSDQIHKIKAIIRWFGHDGLDTQEDYGCEDKCHKKQSKSNSDIDESGCG